MANILIKLLRIIRLFGKLIVFLLKLAKTILTFHRDVRINERLLSNLDELLTNLNSPQSLTKTTADSKSLYQDYDDREQQEYLTHSDLCLVNNKVEKITQKKQREIHLSYIFSEIDSLLKYKNKVTILEVGCGNCINVFEILKKYGELVELHGVDISSNRIGNAKKHFGSALDGANLIVASITEKTSFDNNQFDLVYSMFCLEQISYDIKPALLEMYRIANNKIVMLEPVFENGTFLQKIYLIVSDHTRILLKSIKELGLPLEKNDILDLQFNPSNQSSILIIDKSSASYR